MWWRGRSSVGGLRGGSGRIVWGPLRLLRWLVPLKGSRTRTSRALHRQSTVSTVEAPSRVTARASAGDSVPQTPPVFRENSVLPGPLRPGDYSVRPPRPPMRARCRRAMVRRVQRLVSGPGPAVGSGHRWARGTRNRWVGARFVALFADAHAPNDSVEADRARGLNCSTVLSWAENVRSRALWALVRVGDPGRGRTLGCLLRRLVPLLCCGMGTVGPPPPAAQAPPPGRGRTLGCLLRRHVLLKGEDSGMSAAQARPLALLRDGYRGAASAYCAGTSS